MARSGGRWRDVPERLGDYRSVKRRYYRWIDMGVLDAMLAMLTREADLEWLMIDSTIVRAHQHAAGARTVKGGGCPGALQPYPPYLGPTITPRMIGTAIMTALHRSRSVCL